LIFQNHIRQNAGLIHDFFSTNVQFQDYSEPVGTIPIHNNFTLPLQETYASIKHPMDYDEKQGNCFHHSGIFIFRNTMTAIAKIVLQK